MQAVVPALRRPAVIAMSSELVYRHRQGTRDLQQNAHGIDTAFTPLDLGHPALRTIETPREAVLGPAAQPAEHGDSLAKRQLPVYDPALIVDRIERLPDSPAFRRRAETKRRRVLALGHDAVRHRPPDSGRCISSARATRATAPYTETSEAVGRGAGSSSARHCVTDTIPGGTSSSPSKNRANSARLRAWKGSLLAAPIAVRLATT